MVAEWQQSCTTWTTGTISSRYRHSRGPLFGVGERQRVLFNLDKTWSAGWVTLEPSADGSRFLMLRPSGATARPDELIVVENFLEEVRAKVKK